MTSDPAPETSANATNGSELEPHGAATPMQLAIRNRAIDTGKADQARAYVPLSQRLLTIGLTLIAMLVFVLLINFIVTGMQKIMSVWYPGSINGAPAPAFVEPPPLRPDQPMYITVDPLSDDASGSSASSPAASNH